jgi:hypothetical protein
MKVSRPLAGTAIAAGVLGASLGLGLTMASASTHSPAAVTHSPATASTSARAAGAAGLRNKPAARSGSQAMKASGHPCRNMSGRRTAGAGSSGSSSTGS